MSKSRFLDTFSPRKRGYERLGMTKVVFSRIRFLSSEIEHQAGGEANVVLGVAEEPGLEEVSFEAESESVDDAVINASPSASANEVLELENPDALPLMWDAPNKASANGVNLPMGTETRGPKMTLYVLA